MACLAAGAGWTLVGQGKGGGEDSEGVKVGKQLKW